MSSVPDPFPLFVYGTLRRGETNAGVLSSARLIEPRVLLSGYALLCLGAFPGIVPAPGERVVGELYDVPLAALAALDQLEDYPELYDRRWVELEGGATALTYILQPAYATGRPHVPGGDWVHFRRSMG